MLINTGNRRVVIRGGGRQGEDEEDQTDGDGEGLDFGW